jgi:hypothetical protein
MEAIDLGIPTTKVRKRSKRLYKTTEGITSIGV